MLGDGGGNHPPLSHVWGGCLITDILQEAWMEDQITEAMVLSPGRPSCSSVGAPRMRDFTIVGQETLSLV